MVVPPRVTDCAGYGRRRRAGELGPADRCDRGDLADEGRGRGRGARCQLMPVRDGEHDGPHAPRQKRLHRARLEPCTDRQCEGTGHHAERPAERCAPAPAGEWRRRRRRSECRGRERRRWRCEGAQPHDTAWERRPEGATPSFHGQEQPLQPFAMIATHRHRAYPRLSQRNNVAKIFQLNMRFGGKKPPNAAS